MEWATIKDVNEILQLYTRVVEHVNTTDIKLGWNVDVYPNDEFINKPGYLPSINNAFPSLEGYNYIANEIIKNIK